MDRSEPTAQALTDQQIIEKVAVEVMGWRLKINHTYKTMTSRLAWYDGQGKIQCAEGTPLPWNPLTDWNHTMEVVRKLGPAWNCFMESDGRQTIFAHTNPQRAICLAALQAVSPRA